MKTWANDHAKLELRPSTLLPNTGGKLQELVGLHTDPEHRRQGYATELMKQVCDAADVERVVLVLRPEPFGDGLQDLVPFYARFGFSVIQKKPVLMARMPMMWKAKLSVIGEAVSRVSHG